MRVDIKNTANSVSACAPMLVYCVQNSNKYLVMIYLTKQMLRASWHTLRHLSNYGMHVRYQLLFYVVAMGQVLTGVITSYVRLITRSCATS